MRHWTGRQHAAALGVLALILVCSIGYAVATHEEPAPRPAYELPAPAEQTSAPAEVPAPAELPPEPTPSLEPVAPPPAPEPREVYYANCAEARAAGAAPLRRGEPGYRPRLDRDGNGVACES